MIDRQHPRDLYDLFRFRKAPLSYDSELMRKLAVLFGSTLNRDLRSYNMSRFAGIDEEAIKRLLYPLLKPGDRPTGPEMFAVAKPILEGVLDHRRGAIPVERGVGKLEVRSQKYEVQRQKCEGGSRTG